MSAVHHAPAPPGTISAMMAAHGDPTDWHKAASYAHLTWHLDRESVIILICPTHVEQITVETEPGAVEALIEIYEDA